MFYHFGATNEKGTCCWCGRKLRRQRFGKKDWGDYGDGFFCGLRCGYQFAVMHAELGHRLEAVKNPVKRTPRHRYVYPKCPECKGKLDRASYNYIADPPYYRGHCQKCQETWKYREVKGTPAHVTKFEVEGRES